MPGSQNTVLKRELKELIIKTCRKKLSPDDIPDDAPIIGYGSILELDSLDVLEFSSALYARHGIRIMDSKHAMQVMGSINALADTVEP